MNALFRKLGWLLQRKRKDQELVEEIRFHLEEEKEELEAEGLVPVEAQWAARRSLGNLTSVNERTRETWGWARLERLAQDVRYALRTHRRTPLLTVIIVLSLAIGIGANTAVFSVVDALLLRPLPFPHSERLVAIWTHTPGIGIFRDWPSTGHYLDIQRDNHSFQDVSISRLESWILTGLGDARPMDVMMTTSNTFRMLGARPLLGRVLDKRDDLPGASTAVLTYGAWAHLFGSDPSVLGRILTMDGKPFTIVGVLESRFHLTTEVMPAEEPMETVEVFVPFGRTDAEMAARHDENYNLLAELKPGVSVQQAQADVNVIAAHIRANDKRDKTFGMTVLSLLDQTVGDVRRALWVIFGAVTLVLLSACANVANILLTRAAGREKEIAIRAALGAGSRRLARQLLTESVVLSSLGGAAGLLLAWAALHAVRAMNPGNVPRLDDIAINGRILGFTFCVALATGIVFGLVPVFRALRVDLNTALKAGGRTGHGDSSLRVSSRSLRGLLVVGELALSLMLLVGAGLLIRSFIRIQSVQPGFATSNILTMQLAAFTPKYRNNNEASSQLFRTIEDRIARLPGVVADGVVSSLPMNGSVGWGFINMEGFTPPPGQDVQVDLRTASADYFRTLEIPLKSGRVFNDYDRVGSQDVAVVDEQFARQFWPNRSAVGKHVWFDPKRLMTVVGVVGSVKQYGLDLGSKPAIYFAHAQRAWPQMFLAVRTSTDASGMSNTVVRQIHAIEPNVAVFQVRTMQDLLESSLARRRFSATMLGAFAFFALLLAAVGVYGVIGYLVTQGTHEIGIRMALGARSGDVLRKVFAQGMLLAAAGISVGVVGAAALTRVMSSLLFGVSARDLGTFACVVLLLAAIAAVSTLLPGLRIVRIHPMLALRDE